MGVETGACAPPVWGSTTAAKVLALSDRREVGSRNEAPFNRPLRARCSIRRRAKAAHPFVRCHDRSSCGSGAARSRKDMRAAITQKTRRHPSHFGEVTER